MATEAEWAKWFPVPQAISMGTAIGRFYPGRGGRDQFLDDFLDGKIPEKWAVELEMVIPRETLRFRQMERLIDRFDRTVTKLAEVVQRMEKMGGGKR